MELSPWHYRWLCQFSYIDLPGDTGIRAGRTLRSIAREILRLDGQGELACGRLGDPEKEALQVILGTEKLSGLRLVEFVNRNAGSGLAAYILQDEEGGIHVIFRGSESPGCGVPTGIDWLDNFLAPFRGSVQYGGIREIVRRLEGGKMVFSGHSKGAHNALYALAVSEGGENGAVAFNGQGFARDQLTRAQKARLLRQGVNYVTRGDIVGCLLWHPEKRVFVRKQGPDDAHALSGFTFDRRGEPVQAVRPLWSLAAEWGSRALLRGSETMDGRGWKAAGPAWADGEKHVLRQNRAVKRNVEML